MYDGFSMNKKASEIARIANFLCFVPIFSAPRKMGDGNGPGINELMAPNDNSRNPGLCRSTGFFDGLFAISLFSIL